MKYELLKINLQLFAEPNTNVTTDSGLSDEMKTYYSDYLIDMASPKLVHDQFGQKHPIPKNGGKQIEFRKYDPLPKALTALTEGVTPDGQKLTMSTITSEVHQYGAYITLSDMLMLTAIDNNLVQATKILGKQAGETLDTITREVLNGGTNVQYAEGQVSSRAQLTGGQASGNHYLTVDAIRMAVRTLKNQNAEKIGDSYVGIIHPDISYDLVSDPAWKDVKNYDPEDWYAGEIGKIAGVRFVETTEAKIFKASNLTAANATLKVKSTISAKTATIAVAEAITADDAFKMAGKKVTIGSSSTAEYTILSATAGVAGAASITIDKAITATANDVIATVGGGAGGRAVYSTLILADNAYGVTEIEGGGLQHIVKQLGSAGTADALNQRATVGWKATKTAERLVEPYMVRIETCSTFDSPAN